MNVIDNISDGKYKCTKKNINGGAFSKIYDVQCKTNKKNKYIAKIHKYKYKKEAINEIETLLKLKKNKKKFKSNLEQFIDKKTKPELFKSKLAVLKDYYIDNDVVCALFKKYDVTLDTFNIKYNKMFNETLPASLIKKLFNSLFVGIYELHFSKLIHSDIKPNNILLSLTKYNNIDELLNSVNNKKIKKDDLHKFIDIKIIDFNKSQKYKSIYKSKNIQTLYYTPPEIVLGNRNYNYSVDVWAIMTIIYELMTSLFLFDVYHENIYNGLNFKTYDDDSDDESEESNYDSNSCCSYDDSGSYENESISNLALLHLYHNQLGENNIIEGEEVDKYYCNDKLMGTNNTHTQALAPKIQINNNNTEIVNKFLELYERVYIYDMNNRISSEEIVRTYLF